MGTYSANRDGRYTDYVPIVSRIRNNCFSQNFKGAAVGLFNANLIAKKLGLIEKKEVEATIREQPLFPPDVHPDNGNK